MLCEKHRGEGPLVGPVVLADDALIVSHRPDGPLGYLFLDARRHVPTLGELTDQEAEAVGRTAVRLARALRAESDVAAVVTFVAGLAVPHFHQHVFVRARTAPPEQPWWEPGAGLPGDRDDLVRRLRSRLQT